MPGNDSGNIAVSVLKFITSTRWLPPRAPPNAVTNPPTADAALGAAASELLLFATGALEEGDGSPGCPAFARLDNAALNPALPLSSVPSALPRMLPTVFAP